MDNNNLTTKEKIELTVQAGLQLVPYIGGSLSTLYFGTKQEKRFKRIESFYKEFSKKIKELQIQLPSIDQHNSDHLASLIEELNEKVEKEHTEQKRAYFKKFLFNTLLTPTDSNYDERRFFLDALANMTLLECELLSLLFHQNDYVRVGDISKPGTDLYAIVGSIGRISNYGFLQVIQNNFSIGGGDNSLDQSVRLSNFGRRFVQFCLD